MKRLDILVIGAGMYTCGRGTDGYGTVMPAIFEWAKKNEVGGICVAGTSPESAAAAKKKIEALARGMGMDLPVRYLPERKNKGAGSYKAAAGILGVPACAIVAVPDNAHREVAEWTIRNGLHTLVVKPLVPTMKEARELIGLQRRYGVYCAVEFHKRLDEANLKLRDAISGGLIGDPLCFFVEYSQRKSVPAERFRKWVGTTNVFQYLGVHYLDIIYFATGALPKRAMATGQKGWLASKGIDAYDSIEAMVEWRMPSGRTFNSCIATGWVDPEKTSAMSDQKIKAVGTKGRFESDQKGRGIRIVTDENGIEEPNPYFCSAYGKPGKISYGGYGIRSVCRFLDDAAAIEDGSVTPRQLEGRRPTFAASLASTAALEAVNKSLKQNGRWIKAEEIRI